MKRVRYNHDLKNISLLFDPLEVLLNVLVVQHEDVVQGVVLQPVRVVVEPGGGLDLHEALPARALELVILREPRVAPGIQVPVTWGGGHCDVMMMVTQPTYDGLEGVPDEEDGGVVDLLVVVVLHLLRPRHLHALARGVAVGLHRHHQAAVSWHALAVVTLLPGHYLA